MSGGMASAPKGVYYCFSKLTPEISWKKTELLQLVSLAFVIVYSEKEMEMEIPLENLL